MSFFRNKYDQDNDSKKDSGRSAPGINFQTAPVPIDTDYGSNPVSVAQQVKHLNAYISELVKENERLQNVADDAKTTNFLNKQMLNDYVNIINEQSEELKTLK